MHASTSHSGHLVALYGTSSIVVGSIIMTFLIMFKYPGSGPVARTYTWLIRRFLMAPLSTASPIIPVAPTIRRSIPATSGVLTGVTGIIEVLVVLNFISGMLL